VSVCVCGTEMIKVHCGYRNVPAGTDGCDKENEQECDRVQEHVRILQNGKCCISKESYVDVIDNGNAPNRVAKESCKKVRVIDEAVKEKGQNDMKQYKERKKGIQMDIEAVAPFDDIMILHPAKKSIGDEPKCSGDDDANSDAINEHDPKEECAK